MTLRTLAVVLCAVSCGDTIAASDSELLANDAASALSTEGPIVMVMDGALSPTRNGVPPRLLVTVLVKNVAYDKAVQVLYSEDGWRTTQRVNATYTYTPAGQFEVWSADGFLARGGVAPVEYAVSYTVQGKTFWDNNWGTNYDTSHRRPLDTCAVGAFSATADGHLSAQLKVRNLAYHKAISAKFDLNGQRAEVAAHFTGTSRDGRELWEANVALPVSGSNGTASVYPSCQLLGFEWARTSVGTAFPGTTGQRE